MGSFMNNIIFTAWRASYCKISINDIIFEGTNLEVLQNVAENTYLKEHKENFLKSGATNIYINDDIIFDPFTAPLGAILTQIWLHNPIVYGHFRTPYRRKLICTLDICKYLQQFALTGELSPITDYNLKYLLDLVERCKPVTLYKGITIQDNQDPYYIEEFISSLTSYEITSWTKTNLLHPDQLANLDPFVKDFNTIIRIQGVTRTLIIDPYLNDFVYASKANKALNILPKLQIAYHEVQTIDIQGKPYVLIDLHC